jgi:hypothetical protein
MPRGLSAGLKAHIQGTVVLPIFFVELALSPILYVWNAVGDTSQNDSGGVSRTWKGVGDYGIIRGLASSDALVANSISLGLVGIPSTLVPSSTLAATRSVRYQGKALSVYISAADPNTGAPLYTPDVIWTGSADVITFAFGKEIQIALTGEHETARMKRTSGLSMTTESHNARLGFPGTKDLFFELQERMMGRPRPLLGTT